MAPDTHARIMPTPSRATPSSGTSTAAALLPSSATAALPYVCIPSATNSATSSTMAARCMIAGSPIIGNTRNRPNSVQIVAAAMISTPGMVLTRGPIVENCSSGRWRARRVCRMVGPQT
jgi:hypothetical protein